MIACIVLLNPATALITALPLPLLVGRQGFNEVFYHLVVRIFLAQMVGTCSNSLLAAGAGHRTAIWAGRLAVRGVEVCVKEAGLATREAALFVGAVSPVLVRNVEFDHLLIVALEKEIIFGGALRKLVSDDIRV